MLSTRFINFLSTRWIGPSGAPAFVTMVDLDEAPNFNRFCDDVYQQLPESDRLKTTLLVFRLPVARAFPTDLVSRLCENPLDVNVPTGEDLIATIQDALVAERSFLNQRFGNVQVLFLYSDHYQIVLSDRCDRPSSVFATRLTPAEKVHLCATLKQAELQHLVETTGAILPPITNYPYITPSGDLALRFLRVGNIQRRRTTINAVFFWLLPYLESVAAILVDTWSISTIAYNTSRLLARYRGTNSPIPRVDMLSEYHTDRESELTVNLEVLRRFLQGPSAVDPGEFIVFILSAVNSGKLLNRINESMAREGRQLGNVRFVALYRLRAPFEGRYLCDLSSLDFAYRGGTGVGESDQGELLLGEGDGPGVIRQGSKVSEPTSDNQDRSDMPSAPRVQEEPLSAVNTGGVLPAVSAIPIDPETYFPRLVTEISIKIRNRTVRIDREVYDYYGPLGAFLAHRTQMDHRTSRHHAVYVDTGKVIEAPRFHQRLQEYIERLPKLPDFILGPGHSRANRFTEMVNDIIKRKFGETTRQFAHPNLYFNTRRVQTRNDELLTAFAALDEDSEILILDDAFVTGTRLYQYCQHLRYVRGEGYKGRVHFLVAVARPSAISQWEEARDLLSQRRRLPEGEPRPANTVNAIETMVLPNWSDIDCPWCKEAQRLKAQVSSDTTAPELMRERADLLAARTFQGMTSDLFLTTPALRPIVLTEGSLFTSCKIDSAAFAAVAGGLQRLRTDPSESVLSRRRFPIVTVLDSLEYLKLVYTDSLLRASFFRAAHAEELIYVDTRREDERTGYAKDLIYDDSGEVHNIVLELLWQAIDGKLARNLFDHLAPARAAELEVVEEVQFLRRMRERIQPSA